MRQPLALLIGLVFAAPAIAEATQRAPDAVSRYLVVMKNPDYGALSDRDLREAQACKDDLLRRIDGDPMNKNVRRSIERAEPGVRELVAAAIDRCLRQRTEGVHVLPSGEPLRNPPLR